MSNQPEDLSNYLKNQTIQAIDKMNLSIIQKHHLRILAHCLAILKVISKDNSSYSDRENRLREWCDKESRKFNDKKFSDLLFEKLASTATKLDTFSQKIGKKMKDLEIEDLVLLVEQG